MTMRMLIDARHPEETRVAVVKGNRVEEFDFESAEHKQLKGNIYLAKVTRVEPSLQAAFIDYGGNRHGFLAFSEIHPDYYQIPKADREALLREEAEHAAEEERLRSAHDDSDEDYDSSDDHDDGEDAEHHDDTDENGEPRAQSEEASAGAPRSAVDEGAADELRRKRQNLRRRYKIQDVIQRRQVLLVQVVKEERGNKGAALTTYLSLAGRYCVLMPNTSHGGGISRKISNGSDRKRLKSIMADLNLPSTMGLIVRTAGLSRTKTEIKRDFDYLARLWDEIRERTLGSSAPALIYRDSDLIKRAIRDLYHREIDQVLVEGDEGYKAARGFMKLLMPSHVKKVQQHSESTAMFQRYGVEDQLAAMYHPVVQLKSGGYLVINPTEALVSIDINSGRSTREHNIEQTAYNTNLEAAAEIARQLRLRDMAGLVVIDFIDMEQSSHVRKVEKAMKEALKNDRARIQVGRISSFGLMEMSRQRLRTGVLEASTKACPHCEGTGLMRTASSAGLSALRMIEDEAARGRGEKICLRAGREAAVYLLNKKRAELGDIEQRYGVQVEVIIDESFEGARMSVDSSGPRPVVQARQEVVPTIEDEDEVPADEEFEDENEDEADEEQRGGREERSHRGEGREEESERNGRRRRRRRRGGRGRSRRDGEEGGEAQSNANADATADADAEAPAAEAPESAEPARNAEEKPRRRRRRGKGGGEQEPTAEQAAEVAPDASPMIETPLAQEQPVAPTEAVEEAKPRARRRPRARPDQQAEAPDSQAEAAPEATSPEAIAPEAEAPEADAPQEAAASKAPAAKKPRARRSKKSDAAAEAAPEAASESITATEPASTPAADNDAENETPSEPRRGWWQRTFG
jgi:ribonuclease E